MSRPTVPRVISDLHECKEPFFPKKKKEIEPQAKKKENVKKRKQKKTGTKIKKKVDCSSAWYAAITAALGGLGNMV